MHDEDDRRAFAEATRDVKPLGPDDRRPRSRPRPPAKAKMSRAAETSAIEESLHGHWQESVNGEIEYRQSGVAPKTLQDLRRGRFSVEAELDMHGMTQAQAETELKEFLTECVQRGIGCARVVHGKGARSGPGGPVLKNLVHGLLARTESVLAYSSAVSRHGGSGAVYVLLRARKRF